MSSRWVTIDKISEMTGPMAGNMSGSKWIRLNVAP